MKALENKRLVLEIERLKNFLESLGYSEDNINNIINGKELTITNGCIELPLAKSLVKNIDMAFINDSFEKIAINKNGRQVFLVGKHSCNSATKEYLREELSKKGYRVTNSLNSYGVDTFVVTW